MIGQTLGQYRILEEIGGGGMGVVYRAEDTKLGRDVAVKILSPGRSATDADTERFLREGKLAAALRHPNICTIYNVGDEAGVWFISMDYIPGHSLREMLDKGRVPFEQAVDIASQAARGLKAAHDKGIVHRDIKSANIMVDDDARVSILDFGIAKLSGDITGAGVGARTGTVAYMSPEQTSGEDVDQRTDIWSLGVCLYEMVTGELPFRGEHDSAVIYQIMNLDPPSLTSRGLLVPRALHRTIKRALEKKPADRYHSVDQLITDLEVAREELTGGVLSSEASIAVLPFADMSPDQGQGYFCDGVAEEIINSLAQIEGLRVAARTSSFALRDARSDIREIGRKLNVKNVLEGSVQKSGNRLRVIAQLIDVGDGYHVWSERYDRELEDVFEIQDEIAQNVARAMEVTLSEREKQVIERIPTTNVQAYEFFTRGLHHYHQLNHKSLDAARNMFTSAIVHDPGYALAYCQLANCYSMISTFYDSDHAIVENAFVASRKALELAPDLAEAHASHGLVLSLDGRFDEAEKEFEIAIAMGPKLYEGYYFYARACRAHGDMEKAVEMFDRASEVMPEDYEAPILSGDTCRGLGREDDSRKAFAKGLRVATAHLELHPNEARAWYLGAHAHLELGDEKKALEWSERALALGRKDPATLYNAACLMALMGQVDKCFEAFDLAIEHGWSNRAWLEHDPDLEAIRSDPRYQEMLERISTPH